MSSKRNDLEEYFGRIDVKRPRKFKLEKNKLYSCDEDQDRVDGYFRKKKKE